jgi:Uma2 family endonuclease
MVASVMSSGRLYARASIPEYVIVNLTQDCLEVHRDPDPAAARYRTITTLSTGDRFESRTVPGFAFPVGKLLG